MRDSLPHDANIRKVTIRVSRMPNIGRGYHRACRPGEGMRRAITVTVTQSEPTTRPALCMLNIKENNALPANASPDKPEGGAFCSRAFHGYSR